jgi:alpha-L-fucosidase 2
MTQTRRDVLKLTGLTLAGSFFPASGFGTARARLAAQKGVNFRSAFNPETGAWNIAWPGKLSRYDLVYQSPPVDPLQGIPLGNGEIGVLIWCEDSKIIAAVNKSDLWDDAAFGPFHNWDKKEEDLSTTLRHACRIVIDFRLPLFSTLYLSGFEARLSLADASLTMESASPFGKVHFKAFVDKKTGTIFYDLKTDFIENIPVNVSLERFGSRTFSHWYAQINGDASIGTYGTEASADQHGVYIHQKLASAQFAIAGKITKSRSSGFSYNREHSRRAVISLESLRETETQLAFVVSDAAPDASLLDTKNRLDALKEDSFASYLTSSAEIWKVVWNRSFMDYGDDYLNNLWYLAMYYSLTSQGGKYPGRFNNGLWAWSHDVQNWNFYFHWNQQQSYWPLNAAGHHDLVMPYLDFRFNSLPHARKHAKDFFKTEGAFISDVTDRRGYNSVGEHHNHTPVAEIALDFWRQYQFTGDKAFLDEKALPFMLEASRFFVSLFTREQDGLYHAKEGTGYEGWIKLRDGLTELVYVQSLLSATLSALKVANKSLPETDKWKEILAHLAPLPVVSAGAESIAAQQGKLLIRRGVNKGREVRSDQILAAGWGIKENKWLTVYNQADDGKYYGFNLLDGIFPTVASSPVFPSGLIGVADREKNPMLFEALKSTALLYPLGVTGWDPVPVVLARLGLAEELREVLAKFPERWQIYVNGWGHWGMEHEINKDAEWFFRTNQVSDGIRKEKFPLPMWPFRHMSMESMAVFATALNESLLQSHDGILRIAPAFAGKESARFTLHAVGGFEVSAELISGNVQWVSIKSLHGNFCRLQSPWEKAKVLVNGKNTRYEVEKDIISFKTKKTEMILVVPDGFKVNESFGASETVAPNAGAKFHTSGKAQLGLPRMF